jgi:hypothetical protein
MLEASCTPASNSTPRIIRGISVSDVIELNLAFVVISRGLARRRNSARSRLNARAQIDQRFLKNGVIIILHMKMAVPTYTTFNNIILVKVSMSFLLVSSPVDSLSAIHSTVGIPPSLAS